MPNIYLIFGAIVTS